MGSGKTEMAINKIKSEPENKFVYITPYLDEIKRVKEATYEFNKMYEPIFKGSSKHDNLHKLLKKVRAFVLLMHYSESQITLQDKLLVHIIIFWY